VSDPGLARRARRTLRVWAIRAGLWLGAALPFRMAWGLGTLLGRLAWRVAGHDRELALRHLALALPELSEAERRAVVRDMFLHFAHAAVEWARADEIGGDLERYVEFPAEGAAEVRAAMAEGKGIVCVTGHMGNWELLVRRMVKAGVPFTVIAARSWDRRLDELVEAFRLRGGVPTIYREDPAAGRKLLRSFRDGRALGILTDQDTKVQNVFVPFFGHLAATPRAAADLALRFGAPVFMGASRRRGPRPGDGYVVEWERIPYDPDPADREAEVARLTAASTAALEKVIRKAPSEWVWMHRRWKTRPQ
jgi:Kdo2-lipid IVA lauroyltransferase/acyltransferase